MELDNRILRLIAVGASVPANDQSCLEHNGLDAAGIGLILLVQPHDSPRSVRKRHR
jgi:hypothetical protein